MAIKLTKGNEYAVFVRQNNYGYKTPYENCEIRKLLEGKKLTEVVFKGSYAECEQFVKENCKNKSLKQ